MSESSRVNAYRAVQRQKVQDLLKELKNVPCGDCKGVFPSVCMDFDHVRGEKEFDVSQATRRGWVPLATIRIEVEKCDVVCSNCHRIRTEQRRIASLAKAG